MSVERLERNTRTVSLLTLVSRVTGLARDAALSRCFGIGPVMDALAFAFMLPNLFRRLFGEGALAAAFLPVYARLQRVEGPAAARLGTLLAAALVAGLGAVTVGGELLLWALRRGGAGDPLTLQLMMLTLPYMPLVCLVAILGAMLQSRGRFGPTAAAPVILNLFVVAAALGATALTREPAHAAGTLPLRAVAVAASVTLAGVAQLAWSLAALGHGGLAPWRGAWSAAAELREVLRKAGPMILGLGVLQLNTFVDGLIASWPSTVGPTIAGFEYPLDQGALAALGYAQRLYEFPLGVFGIAVATAIFPLLSRQAAEPEAFLHTLRRGVRLVTFIALPAGAGLMLTSVPLTATVLQGGDFSAADTRRVAFILLGYAPAVWAYSMNHTLTRSLYALGDTMTPVRISLALVGVNFLLNVILICTPLREAGLAWSTALCAMAQVILLHRAVGRRLRRDGGGRIVDGEVGASWGRTLAATAAMSIAVAAVLAFFLVRDAGWGRQALTLVVAVTVGAGVFALAARLMRMPELRWAAGAR